MKTVYMLHLMLFPVQATHQSIKASLELPNIITHESIQTPTESNCPRTRIRRKRIPNSSCPRHKRIDQPSWRPCPTTRTRRKSPGSLVSFAGPRALRIVRISSWHLATRGLIARLTKDKSHRSRPSTRAVRVVQCGFFFLFRASASRRQSS